MREVAVVFDKDGQALFWLDGASGCAVPDSRSLWDIVWENRKVLGGVAHTHPWDGGTGPSGTDLTTFAAIEKGLNLSLVWPIITMTHELYIAISPSGGDYYLERVPPPFTSTAAWKAIIEELRRRSRGVEHG
jgi:hypothetical protein